MLLVSDIIYGRNANKVFSSEISQWGIYAIEDITTARVECPLGYETVQGVFYGLATYCLQNSTYITNIGKNCGKRRGVTVSGVDGGPVNVFNDQRICVKRSLTLNYYSIAEM